jgi:lipoic acid synthetase
VTSSNVSSVGSPAFGSGTLRWLATLGQYLQPTKLHIEVAEFIHPDVFAHYQEEGLNRGLKYVESGPLVRSSYHAERHVHV